MADFLVKLRQKARGVILPVDEIKNKLREVRKGMNAALPILDSCAGKLYFADWFAKEFGAEVCAVDPQMEKFLTGGQRPGIRLFTGLKMCLEKTTKFSLIRACNVFHHISEDESEAILRRYTLAK